MPEAGRSDFSEMLKIRGVPSDEPVFLLRAQDAAAADTVRAWVAISYELGVPACVLEQALGQADAMNAWPVKKPADADHLRDGEAKRLAYQFDRRAWNARGAAPGVDLALAEQRARAAERGASRVEVLTSDPVVAAITNELNAALQDVQNLRASLIAADTENARLRADNARLRRGSLPAQEAAHG